MTTDKDLLIPSLRRSKGEAGFDVSYESGLMGDDHKLADLAKTHEVGKILTNEYPDHIWQVRVSHVQGIIEIKLSMFSRYSHVIHLKNVTSPNDLAEKVKKAGGEWLEIFLQPRGGLNVDRFKESMAKMQRHGLDSDKIDPTKLSADLDAEAFVASKLRKLGIGVEGV